MGLFAKRFKFVIGVLFIVFFLVTPLVVGENKFTGGQAIILNLKNGFLKSYEIVFEGNTYKPYKLDNGDYEIILPIDIDTKEEKDIIIKKYFMGIKYETNLIREAIYPRKIKVVYLRSGDEKMRDRKPQVMEQKNAILDALKHRSNKKLWADNFIMPLNARISTGFAVLRKGKKYNYYHKGIDFAAKEGTKIKAINSGKVILSLENLNVYGNAMIIDHGHGLVSVYFHLKKLLKLKDETVEKGEIIAEVGNTGWSSGPHLHFGIYAQNKPIDPIWWIAHTKQLYKRQ